MIENALNVPDLVFFDVVETTQHQVPVLGTNKPFPESAQFPDKVGPIDAEVRDKIVGAEQIPAEIGFEIGIRPVAIDRYLVFIGVNDLAIRMRQYFQRHQVEGMGSQFVVVVQEGNELSRNQFEGGVRAGRDVPVFGSESDFDAFIPVFPVTEPPSGGAPGRVVIGNAEFPIVIELIEHAMHHFIQQLHFRVISRHHNGNEGLGLEDPDVLGDALPVPGRELIVFPRPPHIALKAFE